MAAVTASDAPAPPFVELLGFGAERPATLTALVRRRASEPAIGHPFVTFLADGDREEETLSFEGLEERGLAIAALLAERGLKPGDRVLIMLPTGLEFIQSFFGVILAGMTAVPVYPPARLDRLEHYLRTLAGIAETAACRAVVLDERLLALVGKRLTRKGQVLVTDAELRAASATQPAYEVEPGHPAFLQFTSGTTSQPRGVLLLHEHLIAQLESYTEALRLTPGEVVVSWLPLYHDLGLIGKVLACLYSRAHLILMSPIDFLKEPMAWLRAISRYRGVHVAAPNFAYQLCVRKCSPERLKEEGIDLSSVENSGMGGEPVSWSTVEAFRAHFAPFGFRPEALNPCYGLAENTLVATGHRRHEPLRTRTVSLEALQRNELVEPSGDDDAYTIVGNGPPFPGMEVAIVTAAGDVVGEEGIGEIWVRGPSLAAGYFDDAEATAATFVLRDGVRWLRTGDLGFLAGGDLFICGRQKDVLIVRGRNYHPQDVEEVVGREEGVRSGNVVAFAVPGGGAAGEQAIVVAELDPRRPRSRDDVAKDVVASVSAANQLALGEVVLVPKGAIPKTSSGKVQRGLVKQAYLRGDLARLAPPGWLATSWLKARLFLAGLGGSRPGARVASGGATAVATVDPRIAEGVRAVRPSLSFELTPDLRLDALGLDSLERVELWVAVERGYDARVPEEAWSAGQTIGELQELLERYAGTADGEARPTDARSLLVQELDAVGSGESPPYSAPFTAPLAFGFLNAVSRTFWGWRVTGHEHHPEGGYLVAGNHESYLDGPWARNALPPAAQRRAIAYTYAGLPGFTEWFVRQMDTIPIDPSGSFRQAMVAGVSALRSGKVLVIFPEGMRSHTGRMRRFRLGAGLLSVISQKPIVPFRLRGSFDIFPRDRSLPHFFGWRRDDGDRLEIRYGEPLAPPVHDPARTWEQAQEVVDRLREAIEAL